MPGKFTEVRAAAIRALRNKSYQFEAREHIDEKNHLQTGLVDEAFVIRALLATRGHQVQRGPHHEMPSVETWTMQPLLDARRWYIKLYLLEDETWFISVHPAEF